MAALPAEQRRATLRNAIAVELAPLRREAGEVLQHLLELEARWLEERALELLACDLSRPEFTVEAIESPVTASIGGLQLNLKVDRIDRLADGTLAVIDYKTGADAQPGVWLEERPRLPQLPLYVEAIGPQRVSAVAFGRVRAGATGFAGLARDKELLPGLSAPPRAYASWSQLLESWHLRLESLAKEYVGGDARLAPNPREACRYCHLPGLCRIGETRLAGELGESSDE